MFNDTCSGIDYDLRWQDWFSNGNIAISGFNIDNYINLLEISDVSINADTYIYDFGDGNTSIEPNPTHTYAADGEYFIQQTISNECFTSVFTDTVFFTNTSIEGNEKLNTKIYPNPVTNKLVIDNPNNEEILIKIKNINGKIINQVNTNITETLNFSDYKKGTYFISIKNDGSEITKKIIKI
ncbi:MAG: T9SS type A sorting domain-containing protein [Bacteroidetes bacterium]|jgi:PKD repeat protein|nr:T9SS type A sorting domain-containing protein [Bacteroidota bacterium]MBT7144936.1 T9SS type A sorting domain-containing protein [Bacteroidota bacterium]MBT7492973.1 T9SS type A sorting domain-containing protein [Bacteroidota bacterium]